MAKKCKDCKGRGRWQEQEIIGGEVNLQWYECNTCHGSGVEQDPDEGDEFDIGGSSYAEED